MTVRLCRYRQPDRYNLAAIFKKRREVRNIWLKMGGGERRSHKSRKRVNKAKDSWERQISVWEAYQSLFKKEVGVGRFRGKWGNRA